MKRLMSDYVRIHAVLALALIMAACTSVYHQAGKEIGTDNHSRLVARVREARRTGAHLLTAITKPAGKDSALPASTESAWWDFDKSVASVNDVVSRMAEPDETAHAVLGAFQRADQTIGALLNGPKGDRAAATTALEQAIARADAFLGPA